MNVSGIGRVGDAGGCPTVAAGIVSAAVIQIETIYIFSAPDDHFTAGPDCCVIPSARGRVGNAGGCPSICAGTVFAASVHGPEGISTPDDNFTAGPHCRVKVSGGWRTGGAGGCPTVCAWIVSPASIQITGATVAAPDDHFAPGPHCRVTVSSIGRVGGAGGSPRVVRASNRRSPVIRSIRYYRKRVARVQRHHCQRHLAFGFSQPRSQRFFQPCNCGQLQPVFALLHYRHGVVMRVTFLQRA